VSVDGEASGSSTYVGVVKGLLIGEHTRTTLVAFDDRLLFSAPAPGFVTKARLTAWSKELDEVGERGAHGLLTPEEVVERIPNTFAYHLVYIERATFGRSFRAVVWGTGKLQFRLAPEAGVHGRSFLVGKKAREPLIQTLTRVLGDRFQNRFAKELSA